MTFAGNPLDQRKLREFMQFLTLDMCKVQRTLLSSLNLEIFSKRSYRKPQVRIWLAWSPTGYLHLGALSTALCNYSLAQANQGILILPLEDVDQTGLVPNAAGELQEPLFWARIIPDKLTMYS